MLHCICIIIIFEITGCTVDMFKCWQVRVIYAPDVPFGHSNDTSVSEISDGSWVDLTRYDTLENQVHINLLMHVVEIFIFFPQENPSKSQKYYKNFLSYILFRF